jgi:hypothetical protein
MHQATTEVDILASGFNQARLGFAQGFALARSSLLKAYSGRLSHKPTAQATNSSITLHPCETHT